MSHVARRARVILGLLCCLMLAACGAAQSSPPAATPSPTSPFPPGICNASNPVTAPALASAGLQTSVTLAGDPFMAVGSANGQWVFVTVDAPNQTSSAGAGIAVLRRSGAGATQAHFFPLSMNPFGEVLTSDGRYLAVANDDGVTVVDTAKAEAGQSGAVLGKIPTSATASTIEVQLTSDGRYVFATDEHVYDGAMGDMSVIDLQAALANDFSSAAVVGTVPLDFNPVGMALSPDGRYLYVTSEDTEIRYTGSLTVVDVQRAEQDPGHAVVARVYAGCIPVRVVLSPAGDVAWVSARAGNNLLAFSTSKLLSDPQHALLATVPVGMGPVGMLLLDQGREMLVDCSDRSQNTANAPQVALLLDTQAALQGKPAVLGSIQEGVFPREIELDGTTALLTNFGSKTLSLIDTTKLPAP